MPKKKLTQKIFENIKYEKINKTDPMAIGLFVAVFTAATTIFCFNFELDTGFKIAIVAGILSTVIANTLIDRKK